MEFYHLFYQVKVIRKGSKPPVWRRCMVPAYVSFSQMALILMEMLEIPVTPSFEFEFFHRKDRIIERGAFMKPSYDYDYFCASETLVDQRFREETWFTFRIMDASLHIPEYRVEIEEGVQLDITDEDGTHGLTFPLVRGQKSCVVDQFWSRPDDVNDRLRAAYQISTGEPPCDPVEVLVENIREQGTGIIAGKERQDRDVLLKESAQTGLEKVIDTIVEKTGSKEKIQDLMERLGYNEEEGTIAVPQEEGEKLINEFLEENYDQMRSAVAEVTSKMRKELEGDAPAEHKPQRPRLEKALKDSYTMAALLNLAEEYQIPVSGKQKGKIAYEMARYLLTADNMRMLLLQVDHSELELFDAMMEKDCFLPDPTGYLLEGLLYELCYLVKYTDGYLEIPGDVKTIYSTLRKTGYLEYHKKAIWILQCMKAFCVVYVYAPTRILYRLYRSNKELKESFEEFQKLLDKFLLQLGLCKIVGDHVIAKSVSGLEIGKKIETISAGMQYYILDQDEIESFSSSEYPANEKAYQDLEAYLKQQGVDHFTRSELCAEAYLMCAMGDAGIEEFLETLKKQDLLPKTKKEQDRLAEIMVHVYENTRSFMLRGNKPIDVARTSKQPISPESPYSVNFSGNNLGNKSSEPVTAEKKIYPNDPCPCGSGLKYKKCCGRK